MKPVHCFLLASTTAWAVAASDGFAAPAIASPEQLPPILPPVYRSDPPPDEARVSPSAAPTVEWTLHKTADGSHPDGNEQAMLWLMNRARANPEQEGVFLAGLDQSDIAANYEVWGVDLHKMQEEFAQIPARQPAAFDRRIYEGSRAHSEDLIVRDAQDHNNQFERVADAGFATNGASASVFSRSRNPLHAHAGFNVDWGNDGGVGDGMQVGRGHRQGLMNSSSPRLTNVGIAMAPEDDPDTTNVGPLVTSIVYAQANTFSGPPDHFNIFIVGTVWDDLNDNGIYDSGEGMADVTVMPSVGTYYAVTGNAGGFAIPAQADGVYTLSFSGGELAEPEQRSLTIAGQSALVRWRPEDAYGALEDPIVPTLAIRFAPQGLLLSWTALADHDYQLQRSQAGQPFVDDERPVLEEDDHRQVVIEEEEIQERVLFRLRAQRSAPAPSSAVPR